MATALPRLAPLVNQSNAVRSFRATPRPGRIEDAERRHGRGVARIGRLSRTTRAPWHRRRRHPCRSRTSGRGCTSPARCRRSRPCSTRRRPRRCRQSTPLPYSYMTPRFHMATGFPAAAPFSYHSWAMPQLWVDAPAARIEEAEIGHRGGIAERSALLVPAARRGIVRVAAASVGEHVAGIGHGRNVAGLGGLDVPVACRGQVDRCAGSGLVQDADLGHRRGAALIGRLGEAGERLVGAVAGSKRPAILEDVAPVAGIVVDRARAGLDGAGGVAEEGVDVAGRQRTAADRRRRDGRRSGRIRLRNRLCRRSAWPPGRRAPPTWCRRSRRRRRPAGPTAAPLLASASFCRAARASPQ